jgi:histidinol-phosphatase (PHP family)
LKIKACGVSQTPNNEMVERILIMPITADYHLHSSFSGDSEIAMEDMILRGIELGFKTLCFTEHLELDFPVTKEIPEGFFSLNTDSYLYELIMLREKYADQIIVNLGVEMGVYLHLLKEMARYIKAYDFDFVIASTHVCSGKDPYQPEFYEGRSDQDAYREFFQSTLNNIQKFTNFDVIGHLDYAVRYGPNQDKNYIYDDYRDVLDELLTELDNTGKGLEVNTSALVYGLKEFNPSNAILKRYRELGGEIVTVGSDAHALFDIGRSFDRVAEVLKECGFKYYSVFEKRAATFLPL